jgi:zinc transporter ZupT
MELSLQLRVVAIFEIFIISAVGAYLPLYILEQTTLKKVSEVTVTVAVNESQQLSETLLFRSLKCFSGGLVVAVAFCHLLADSVGDLSDDSLVKGTPGFPLTMSLAMTGVIFLVCLEQMTVVALDMVDNYEIHPSIDSNTTNYIEQLPPSIIDQSVEEKPQDDRENDACDNPSHLHLQITTEIGINQQQPVIASQDVTTVSVAEDREKKVFKKQFLKLIIFEFSVALHSVIIGFNLGILTTADLPEIKILMVALGFHQFFEGFSLGRYRYS